MREVFNMFQIGIATLGGWLGYLVGGFDGFMYVLVTMVIIDYITGVMVAILEKKLSSEVGFRGICKKVLIFCLVAIASVVDTRIIGSGAVIRTATIFFYISNEGVSILENVSNIGLPIPNKLQEVLEQIKERSGDDDADN